MRWLVHGTLSRAVDEALVRHEHSASRLDDEDRSSEEILEHARVQQLDIVTDGDALVSAATSGDSRFARSIVFLQLEGGEVEQDDAIDRLFARYKRLTPGRLYTVTGSRVKVRQLPTGK